MQHPRSFCTSTRYRVHIPCIGKAESNHWTAREVRDIVILILKVAFFHSVLILPSLNAVKFKNEKLQLKDCKRGCFSNLWYRYNRWYKKREKVSLMTEEWKVVMLPSHINLLLRWEDNESSLLLAVTMYQTLFLSFTFSISFVVHDNSVDRL